MLFCYHVVFDDSTSANHAIFEFVIKFFIYYVLKFYNIMMIIMIIYIEKVLTAQIFYVISGLKKNSIMVI